MSDTPMRRQRWRIILGKGSEEINPPPDPIWEQREKLLEFLYDREYDGRNVRPGSTAPPPTSGAEAEEGDGPSGKDGGEHAISPTGSLDPSNLTVPEWINAIHELFPRKTVERIEKDALERYKLEEMVTNRDLLAHAQPSLTLLKAILRTKHLMNQEVIDLARTLIRRTIEELLKSLAQEINTPFSGALNRNQRSLIKVSKNFSPQTTIRRNLANYDPIKKKLFIKTPYFNSRVRPQSEKWQIIILVDQSGSMINSVIHSAITASIFWGIKSVRTHLIVFDTSIVDLTEHCNDPTETLMKVQLGGGTNIGQALSYAETIIENPRRTILILISDFFEGADPQVMLSVAERIISGGTQLLGLAALDENANPNYNHAIAAYLAELGAHVGAMTPGELASWVAEKVRR